MSDALNFLAKARPDAMPHYFAFLKQCGNRLDPKTRDLISVITKVHAQTERGFRQYLKRALNDGCSAEEIIDALLMAFPALGFSKIVWAVDQILAMKLPEFERLAGQAATAPADFDAAPTQSMTLPVPFSGAERSARAWHDVMPDNLTIGEARCASVDGRGVVVYRGTAGLTVYDNRCPHQGTPIEQTNLGTGDATCPKHAWRFDLATGTCTDKGDRPLTKLDSRVAYGRVLARW